MSEADDAELTPKLVDALYAEAMLLADRARSYFDGPGKAEREALSPADRVAFSCESLRVTTRLMHTVSWLLNRKAVSAGEISEAEGRNPDRRIGSPGEAQMTPEDFARLPVEARRIADSSRDLYERVKRLDEQLVVEEVPLSPARQLLGKLEGSF